MNFSKIAFALVLLALLVGCRFSPQSSGSFYTHSKRGDLYRIPLIEPFELISADQHYWFIEISDSSSGQIEQLEVEAFFVDPPYVVTHTKSSDFSGRMSPVWVIIEEGEDTEIHFDEKSFSESARRHGYLDLPFLQPSEVFSIFESTGELPFFHSE